MRARYLGIYYYYYYHNILYEVRFHETGRALNAPEKTAWGRPRSLCPLSPSLVTGTIIISFLLSFRVFLSKHPVRIGLHIFLRPRAHNETCTDVKVSNCFSKLREKKYSKILLFFVLDDIHGIFAESVGRTMKQRKQ